MKLRNKKTGEIGYTTVLRSKDIVVMDENAIQLGSYTSLAELNKEWEDYEEPKEYCFVSEFGKVYSLKNIPMDKERIGWLKQFGNYFETREEAEKAVEKLKAWKRLKDNGFRFNNFVRDAIYYEISNEEIEKDVVREDLDLLFGGEE